MKDLSSLDQIYFLLVTAQSLTTRNNHISLSLYENYVLIPLGYVEQNKLKCHQIYLEYTVHYSAQA